MEIPILGLNYEEKMVKNIILPIRYFQGENPVLGLNYEEKMVKTQYCWCGTSRGEILVFRPKLMKKKW